jgi:hypothetical protein
MLERPNGWQLTCGTRMILDANRELAQQATGEGPVIREPLKIIVVLTSAWPSSS